ncbi:MAG: 30S ribosomal protein S12 methylthiotransferase RimO [Omnitrophica bacterium]|nr:30S ribosomal protein S12 methylthiotransferase RimO [Candidatus Omnitrophota bacterium]
MKPDIFIISLGCPRNLVDSEVLEGTLKSKGFRVVGGFRKRAIAIVNTCGFIEDAKQESIDIILELAELKKRGEIPCLIVAGCLPQRYRSNLTAEISEIDAIFGCSTFAKIPAYLESILKGRKVCEVSNKPRFLYDHKTPRSVITPRHSVYVKIQEGCMNFCSYCVIPKIRGPFRSRSTESVLREMSSLKASGAKEISLIGQDTTLYGVDRYKNLKLAHLLKKASRIMKRGWLRLLYTHPAHYTDELIDVVRVEPSVCKYLDLPIQHINDKILKRMNRRVTKKNIISLIAKLRRRIPNLAIRTSMIVGFPGETEKDFRELESFIKEFKFDRLGAFMYSREEGTRAYNFKNQLSREEKSERLKRIMEIQKSVASENNRAYLGKTVRVLIDEKVRLEKGQYVGRTEHDAPEVDGNVYVRSARSLKKGDFVDVKIEDTLEYDLVGSV